MLSSGRRPARGARDPGGISALAPAAPHRTCPRCSGASGAVDAAWLARYLGLKPTRPDQIRGADPTCRTGMTARLPPPPPASCVHGRVDTHGKTSRAALSDGQSSAQQALAGQLGNRCETRSTSGREGHRGTGWVVLRVVTGRSACAGQCRRAAPLVKTPTLRAGDYELASECPMRSRFRVRHFARFVRGFARFVADRLGADVVSSVRREHTRP